MRIERESRGKTQRILVIDDDAAFGEYAEGVLERAGFFARFHRGPFGTLMAIKEMGCDLVLLDVSMPRLDGPMLMHMIRNAFGSTRMRIFLCSGMTPGPLARIAKEIGADGSITKEVLDRAQLDEIWALLGEPEAPSQRSYRGRELLG